MNAPRVIINVRKNQWNCLQVESLLSIYVSAALTFIADDGDAHAKRCFLYLEKNAQVTDESIKSEFAQITSAILVCQKCGLIFLAFVNVYLFLSARPPARGPPSLKSSALSEHTWCASLPPCRAFLSVISGTESVILRQGCVGTNAINPAVTYCHRNGMVSNLEKGDRHSRVD